jgi:hypothetical protein
MAKCDYCNGTIIFGAKKYGGRSYCGSACLQKAQAHVSQQFDPQQVAELVQKVHQGKCPVCQGDGPVDVHTAHTVWSAFVVTRWGSRSQVCCRSCGNKARLNALLSSLCLGWWGVPWGIIMTPAQIGRNLSGMMKGSQGPSNKLNHLVRTKLGAQMMQPQAPPVQEYDSGSSPRATFVEDV